MQCLKKPLLWCNIASNANKLVAVSGVYPSSEPHPYFQHFESFFSHPNGVPEIGPVKSRVHPRLSRTGAQSGCQHQLLDSLCEQKSSSPTLLSTLPPDKPATPQEEIMCENSFFLSPRDLRNVSDLTPPTQKRNFPCSICEDLVQVPMSNTCDLDGVPRRAHRRLKMMRTMRVTAITKTQSYEESKFSHHIKL